jgi:hypothetical protein
MDHNHPHEPGYHTPLPGTGTPPFPGFGTPDPNPFFHQPLPNPPVLPLSPTWFEKGPGCCPNRRPSPGERVFVLDNINDGFEVIIRGGTVYSVAACGEDGVAYMEVNWHEFNSESVQYETTPQADCFYWFEDAQKEAERRVRERQQKAEEETDSE